MKRNFLIKTITLVLFCALMTLGIWLTGNKALWNDELYSQVYGIEKLSYGQIIAGKIPEGNNSPLFYVLQKAVCDVTHFQLPFVWKNEWAVADAQGQLILRLFPNFFMSLALAAIFYVFAVEYSLIVGIYAFVTALTTELVWAYWAEARPYGLWYCLSAFQALYFFRFVRAAKNDDLKTKAHSWRILSIVHVLLSLTAVFGTVQAFIVSMILFVLYQRKLMPYVLMLFVPLLFGFYYFLNAPHYVFGLPPDPMLLIFENISQGRILLICFSVLFALIYSVWRKDIKDAEVIVRYGSFLVLLIVAAFGIMLCLTSTAQEGWDPFTVSSRYFIFLAPVGAVAAAVFPVEVLKMLRIDRRVSMVILIVLSLVVFAMLFTKDAAFKKLIVENPITLNLQDQRDKVKNKAMMITINHYRPDMTKWKDFIVEGKTPDKSFLNDSLRYYDMIGSYVPGIAEPQYMAGLCHALLGDVPAALAAQEKAAILEPRFFWGWYNLGILYYRQGEFAKSSQSFRKALTVPPQAAVKIMTGSMIYEEVIRGMGPAQSIAATHLQQGYRNAALMLEASVKRLRGQPAGVSQEQMSLKLF